MRSPEPFNSATRLLRRGGEGEGEARGGGRCGRRSRVPQAPVSSGRPPRFVIWATDFADCTIRSSGSARTAHAARAQIAKRRGRGRSPRGWQGWA